ncbi:MAG TPA: S8 family serine peptidase [Candidatus Udaeobacter sp.]|nr:S8 family serine peptidase [Candidatus Udaeobacter sp.]
MADRNRISTKLRAAIVIAVLPLITIAFPAAPRAAADNGPSAAAGRPALTSETAAKLDPRLIPSMLSGADEPEPVWVSFADKGESGPSDLAGLLDRARLDLSPRATARRLRTGVTPLVDYRDVPLYRPYLEAMRGLGWVPFATSRWLNRAAFQLPGSRLSEVAALPFVGRLAPVERARRFHDVPDEAVKRVVTTPPECADCVRSTHSINYGLNATAVNQLDVPAVHDSGYIGTGVLVCIIDDGFNYHNKHEALRNADVPPGYERDFVDGDSSAQDTVTFTCCDHGTWVMGCIAGNKPGTYVGTAPGATFALARTEVDASESTIEMVYWGMAAEWADSLGADLITTSLGYNQFDNSADNYTYADMDGHTTTVAQAAEIAASKGILVVAAAGNEGNNSWKKIVSPADVNGDSLIAIGAVNSSGTRASFSSMGPTPDHRIKPDLMALGVSNWLTDVTGNPQAYTQLSGTSFATPTLAGLAACMIQARPMMNPTSIIKTLRETASRATNPDTLMGYGIPDGLKALRWTTPGLGVEPEPVAALGMRLLGPNPRQTCDATVVRFALGSGAPSGARGRVGVFDAQGRRLTELFNGPLARGNWYEASWDGQDASGRDVPAGLYFITFEAAGRHSSVRVVSLR